MVNGKTLYGMCAKGDIAKYVLLSGDPWRVDVLAKNLENPRHIAFSREYNTYTGTYKGVEVTVSSTGIGAPPAAIAMVKEMIHRFDHPAEAAAPAEAPE